MENASVTTKVINFNLNTFIDSHPVMFCAGVLISLALLCIFIFFVGKGIAKVLRKGGKFGPVEIPSDEIKKETTKYVEETIIRHDMRFIGCLCNIVQNSVKNGFDKSIKRQELFNKQRDYTESRFRGIISSIAFKYLGQKNNSVMKYVEIVLEYILKENIYIPLERIYKADKLTERSKEDLIEENRVFIDTIGNIVLKKVGEIVYADPSLNDINSDLICSVKEKQEEIKKATIDCLNRAHDLAKEEITQLIRLQEELNENIQNALSTYLGEEIKDLNIPANWNDDMPPNDIIGEVR